MFETHGFVKESITHHTHLFAFCADLARFFLSATIWVA